MSRPSRLALAALLAATVPAAGQDDFWISVGSFKSFDAAQRLQAKAALTLAEPVQMLPAEVAGRNVFRVVGGPYESRAAAAEHARNAQTSGYPDAWVLRAPSFATAAAPSPGLEALPEFDGDVAALDAVGEGGGAPSDAAPTRITEAVDDGLAGGYRVDSPLDIDVTLGDEAGIDAMLAEGSGIDATFAEDAGIDAALAEDAALDLDFDELANFDDFASLAALDDFDDFDDLENLATTPPTTRSARQPSFIETTEEPAWEAPPGFTLHRLPGPGDGTAGRSFPDQPAGRDGGGGVMCKLIGWLPFVKSCDDR